jgi:hypothetical protein
MNYLSKTVPIYSINRGGQECGGYQHDQVWIDDDSGEVFFTEWGKTRRVYEVGERPAEWFSVAVYTSEFVYGGPEEGGWYYQVGGLVEHHKIKFFDKYDDADKYAREMWDECEKGNKDRGDVRLVVRCTTESMPDMHYPKRRPYYC